MSIKKIRNNDTQTTAKILNAKFILLASVSGYELCLRFTIENTHAC